MRRSELRVKYQEKRCLAIKMDITACQRNSSPGRENPLLPREDKRLPPPFLRATGCSPLLPTSPMCPTPNLSLLTPPIQSAPSRLMVAVDRDTRKDAQTHGKSVSAAGVPLRARGSLRFASALSRSPFPELPSLAFGVFVYVFLQSFPM